MPLTRRQRRFAEEYLVDLNPWKAALRAEYTSKMAESVGNRLVNNVEVKDYMQVLNTRAAELTNIDLTWYRNRLRELFDKSFKDSDTTTAITALRMIGESYGFIKPSDPTPAP